MNKLILAIRLVWLRLFGRLAHCGFKVVCQRGVTMRGVRHIWLGSNVSLDSFSTLQVEVDQRIGNGPHIVLHDFSGIGKHTSLLAINRIEIERDAMIGPGCVLVDYDHAFADTSVPIRLQPLVSRGPIIVKQGAWVAGNVTICSGVTIGKNAVIGANSVVTHDIPDYSVAVGAPAKVVKHFDTTANRWKKVQ